MLRVELATHSGHFQWTAEYGNFKITKDGSGNYGYKVNSTNYRTDFCLKNAFKVDTATFGMCSNGAWFVVQGNCNTHPYRPNGIRWAGMAYSRISLLLRHGELSERKKLKEDDGLEINGGRVGRPIPYFGTEFCVSFDIFSKPQSNNNGKSAFVITEEDKPVCDSFNNCNIGYLEGRKLRENKTSQGLIFAIEILIFFAYSRLSICLQRHNL